MLIGYYNTSLIQNNLCDIMLSYYNWDFDMEA